MKNLFSILAAFFVGILICISVLACANDPDDVNNNSSAIAAMQNQISKLTSKIEELEGKLAAAEEKIDNIEDEIDYELVFQKFNQYFEGCDCNYDEDIAELKKQMDNLKTLSAEELFPKIISYSNIDSYGTFRYTTEYDNMGRLITFTITRTEPDGIRTEKTSITYNNNQCIVYYDDNKATFTLDCSEISTPALNYFILTYFP